jgi:hypothetical protein
MRACTGAALDIVGQLIDNQAMKAIQPTSGTPEVLADLEEAARYAASGVRDPEVMRRACQRMDVARENLRQEIGEVDVAVSLIREIRDQEG